MDASSVLTLATDGTSIVLFVVVLALALSSIDFATVIERRSDPHHFRPAEVDLLVGDASKARLKLGWTPQTSFEQLVCMMVDADMAAVVAEF